MTPENEEEGTFAWANKLPMPVVATIGTIVVAAISGAVSYLVTTQTVDMERLRLESENTINRSEMFQSLIKQVQAPDQSAYALLALWKLYPEDKKLIVITALQNPTAATLTILRALGYDEELSQYSSTIESIMSNGTKEQRDAYSRLFLEVSPQSVLSISMDATIKSQEPQYLAGPALEVLRYLQLKPTLIPLLEEKVESDPRISDNDRLRMTFALVLYLGNSHKVMAAILDEAAESIQNFSRLAPLFTREAISALLFPERERLFGIAVDYLQKVETDDLEEHYFNDGAGVVENAREFVQVPAEKDEQLAKIYSDVYTRLAKKGSFSKLALKLLGELNQEAAQKLYLVTLACHEGREAEVFFLTFEAKPLGIPDWNAEGFRQAKTEATRQMSGSQSSCNEG